MKKIAFIQSKKITSIEVDEFNVFKPLFYDLGWELESVDWKDKEINWSEYSCIIPKCAWDYMDKYSEFMLWLKQINKKNISLKNSYKIIQWNSHKQYLIELLEKGASVVDLKILKNEIDIANLDQFVQSSAKFVIKPAISGGAKNTKVYDKSMIQSAKIDAQNILKESEIIIQPFIEEISEGECSFVFYKKDFSHAVLKRPKNGDFRIHPVYGGNTVSVNPTKDQIKEASKYLDYVPDEFYYARVDGIYINNKFHLLELELIEPYLYLEYAQQGCAEKFVKLF